MIPENTNSKLNGDSTFFPIKFLAKHQDFRFQLFSGTRDFSE